MVRMLRDDMLLAMAEAFELQSLSLSLDIDMALVLHGSGWGQLDTTRYGETYRACNRRIDREKQIEHLSGLMDRAPIELNKLVHHRLVLWMVKTVRGPARAAGFGRLQSFLEQGLNAFRVMGDGTEFIETIWRRESTVMQRMFAADGAPFDIQQNK